MSPASTFGGGPFALSIGFSALALLTLIICPLIGGSGLSYGRTGPLQDPDWNIFIRLRLPRALLALLSGASLAIAGTLFQALLRSALAEPSSLGVSAAASLGAVIAISTSFSAAQFPVVSLFADGRRGGYHPDRSAGLRTSAFLLYLLLTGIAINGVCSAAILLLNSLAGITKSFQIAHWLMGGIDAIEYSSLAVLAVVVIPVCLWILVRPEPGSPSYGDTWAAGRGVDTRRLSIQGFIAGALLAGTLTAVTGPSLSSDAGAAFAAPLDWP